MSPIHGRWLIRFASLISPAIRAQRPDRRTLHAEVLERRCVLSVAPVPLESEALSLEAYVAAGHEMGPVEPSAIEDAPAGEALNPSAVDLALNDGDADGVGNAGPSSLPPDVAEGEEGLTDEDDEVGIVVGQDLPPQIEEFSAVISGSQLLIFGRISDDHELTACVVHISGLVSQSDLPVDEFGNFEWRTEIPLASDYIYAVAYDGHSESAVWDTFFTA